MFKLDLEKAEEPEIKLPTAIGSQKKAREFQKNIYFCFTDYAKASDCVDHNKMWKVLQEMGIPDREICMQVKKQLLEPDLEQWTGSKLGKEASRLFFLINYYCHPAYLT